MAKPPTDSALEYGTTLVVAGDRPAEVVAFESGVVGMFVQAAELFGVPKSVAAIYGVVFASAEPLTFGEIEARLDISKGSVSQGLKVLREVGAVRETDGEVTSDSGSVTGNVATNHQSQITDHRARARSAARYAPDLEMRKLLERFLANRVERQLASNKAQLESLRKQAAQMSAAQRAVLGSRVQKLEQWHTRTRGLLPLVRTFLKLGG